MRFCPNKSSQRLSISQTLTRLVVNLLERYLPEGQWGLWVEQRVRWELLMELLPAAEDSRAGQVLAGERRVQEVDLS